MATEESAEPISRFQIYHAINRAKRLADAAERYNNDPKVIAKRAEREQKKAEKEAANALKLAHKEERIQKKRSIELAAAAVLEKRTPSCVRQTKNISDTPVEPKP